MRETTKSITTDDTKAKVYHLFLNIKHIYSKILKFQNPPSPTPPAFKTSELKSSF